MIRKMGRFIYHALPIAAQHKINLRRYLNQISSFPLYTKKISDYFRNRRHSPDFIPLKKTNNLPDVIIFSLKDWDFIIKNRHHSIIVLAKQGYRIFYISKNFLNYTYPGFEAKKILEGLPLYEITLSLKCSPANYNTELSMKGLQKLKKSLADFMLWAQISSVIAFVQHPFWSELAFVLPNSQVIYDRPDHSLTFNEFSAFMSEKEKQLLKEAHLVVTHFQKLYASLNLSNESVALIRDTFDIKNILKKIQEPLVSIIILTYNNLSLTKACLESIQKYTDYKNIEIIIVDNASTDDTPNFLRENYQHRAHYKIIFNKENKGFAAGNNIGLKSAAGEYLILLNNDTRVTPGWIQTMINYFRRNPKLGLLGPVTNNIGNEAKITTKYKNPDNMFPEVNEIIYKNMGNLLSLNTLAFFCVMMPRIILERIGLLDESYEIGFFEDDDYCQRVHQAHYDIYCAQDVFIHHHLSASFDQMGAEKRRNLFEKNKKIYESKWGPWRSHRYR
jgi:GT2 family glycosyltransferase